MKYALRKRILVTGGAGFQGGGALSRDAGEQPYQVINHEDFHHHGHL
ncbi:hypothetical protein ThimaDRAFT_0438 [Thiocapsa marina 5811]|uniref:Uncharacterized protein n=1 Tax=Thiocapsa marina 5811 TaxID=768671 RepID=F9U687_9GAMM|nr:hypothetical protein ThimaDRAFT_0438 [Thiocapsa marina 5811]